MLSATPGAKVGLGLKPGTRRTEVEASIRNNEMEQLLNWIPVKTGEMIYVDAGTVHAIGPDCVLLEAQQNSDTTYRLYDYGRPRELHIERGLEAIKEVTRAGKVKSRGGNGRVVLISSPSFEVDKMLLKTPKTLTTEEGPGANSRPRSRMRGLSRHKCRPRRSCSCASGGRILLHPSTMGIRVCASSTAQRCCRA